MAHSTRTLLTLVAALVLAAVPMTTHAASCGTKHSLPKASSTGLNIVFSFGVSGGNIRPWSASIALDGTVRTNGSSTSVTKLTDPKNTLKALLALADAQGFFSMGSQNSCSGSVASPDAGSQNIAITTSTGTKRVSVFGGCKGKFEGLYELLEATAGIGR